MIKNIKIIILLGILFLIISNFIPIKYSIVLFLITLVIVSEFFSIKTVKFKNYYISELLIPIFMFSKNTNKPTFHFNDRIEYWHRGKLHNLNGPSIVYSDQTYSFYLNGIHYENVNDWLKDHPNKDIAFQAKMILQYS